MKISKFFKKNEKVSVEQLAERHGGLKAQLAELKSKEESLLQSALYDDAQNLAPQLADCRLQQELAQSALSEVRRRLQALLESEIESEAMNDCLPTSSYYEQRLDRLYDRGWPGACRRLPTSWAFQPERNWDL